MNSFCDYETNSVVVTCYSVGSHDKNQVCNKWEVGFIRSVGTEMVLKSTFPFSLFREAVSYRLHNNMKIIAFSHGLNPAWRGQTF